ncbi:HIT domain-containing protein [Nocardioides sp. TF02-7]|uniref:HIT domain-containing protein n=1 Tax=Nocardioides sp. TF02-7 TaxID=2917724 RepID=UPI001F068506|nr:HIT domain-containing protein [Nocardioides sp. TF02-7]UMG92908.1 HIT domain-containing protein [Nocardioides sp. TF02-7]
MTSATPTDPDCLFCKIVAGEIPADVVHEGAATVAFRDINPQAPLHVLVVPRAHHENAAASAAADAEGFAALFAAAAEVARAEGHDDYRLVFNTGAGVGQTVFHTHLHVIAGRPMTWPPG